MPLMRFDLSPRAAPKNVNRSLRKAVAHQVISDFDMKIPERGAACAVVVLAVRAYNASSEQFRNERLSFMEFGSRDRHGSIHAFCSKVNAAEHTQPPKLLQQLLPQPGQTLGG